MKIAILNDTHCGVRNSSDIFLQYQERFYGEVFFPYLEEHGIKNILHLGDYYEHRKFVNFKALNANRKHFLEPMRDKGITMDIIPGNHDVYFKNTNELCSLKELLGYFTSNVNICMKPTVLDYDGLKVAVIPVGTDKLGDVIVPVVETAKARVVSSVIFFSDPQYAHLLSHRSRIFLLQILFASAELVVARLNRYA